MLASIVEKETGVATDRPRIAGVFTRRACAGMRLQTDPTVIYGIGAHYDGDIRTQGLDDGHARTTPTRAPACRRRRSRCRARIRSWR